MEAQLECVTKDVAAYAETLSMKDEIVKSLTQQLADVQDTGTYPSGVSSSGAAGSFLETTQHLDQLTVFHRHFRRLLVDSQEEHPNRHKIE